MTSSLAGKTVLVTGGTGSLGKVLLGRLLGGEMGMPAKVVVFSRDETKQHQMRLESDRKPAATDEIIYHNFERALEFRIGDVRDYRSIVSAMRHADVIIHAAAMKQVPTCEYFPFEAVRTNVEGAENIVRGIEEFSLPVQAVVGVSTDKACRPANVMGMTKALQERIFVQGNMRSPATRFVCVRYGNVFASRGSVIPLFHDQIRKGGPVTITTPQMTRFVLSLDNAVDTIFAALRTARPGETYVPRSPSARIVDIATALIGGRDIEQKVTGIRPGEKIHEIMVSEDEASRTVERGQFYVIKPLLPELGGETERRALAREFSSADDVMSLAETTELLRRCSLMVEDNLVLEGERLE